MSTTTQPKHDVPNKVATYRAAGLEARWTKASNGTPFIAIRNPQSRLAHQRDKWWLVTKAMHEAMQDVGILEAFDRNTLLGDIFSVRG